MTPSRFVHAAVPTSGLLLFALSCATPAPSQLELRKTQDEAQACGSDYGLTPEETLEVAWMCLRKFDNDLLISIAAYNNKAVAAELAEYYGGSCDPHSTEESNLQRCTPYFQYKSMAEGYTGAASGAFNKLQYAACLGGNEMRCEAFLQSSGSDNFARQWEVMRPRCFQKDDWVTKTCLAHAVAEHAGKFKAPDGIRVVESLRAPLLEACKARRIPCPAAAMAFGPEFRPFVVAACKERGDRNACLLTGQTDPADAYCAAGDEAYHLRACVQVSRATKARERLLPLCRDKKKPMACACLALLEPGSPGLLSAFEAYKKNNGCVRYPTAACESEGPATRERLVERAASPECQAIANDNAYRSQHPAERDKQGILAPGFFTQQQNCTNDRTLVKVYPSPAAVAQFAADVSRLCAPSKKDLLDGELMARDFPNWDAASPARGP